MDGGGLAVVVEVDCAYEQIILDFRTNSTQE